MYHLIPNPPLIPSQSSPKLNYKRDTAALCTRSGQPTAQPTMAQLLSLGFWWMPCTTQSTPHPHLWMEDKHRAPLCSRETAERSPKAPKWSKPTGIVHLPLSHFLPICHEVEQLWHIPALSQLGSQRLGRSVREDCSISTWLWRALSTTVWCCL